MGNTCCCVLFFALVPILNDMLHLLLKTTFISLLLSAVVADRVLGSLSIPSAKVWILGE